MYTTKQKQIINHTRQKVQDLLANYKMRAHGIDHITRVAKWAVEIAKKEKDNVFLCELSAWLHDIGRAEEDKFELTRKHHELSYQMCQEWFKTDPVLSQLSYSEKLIILYSVRFHWNDAADKYSVAWILRDADKMDLFGKAGNERALVALDKKTMDLDLRLRFGAFYWLRTKSAKAFIKKRKLMEPVEKLYVKLLKEGIKKVEI